MTLAKDLTVCLIPTIIINIVISRTTLLGLEVEGKRMRRNGVMVMMVVDVTGTDFGDRRRGVTEPLVFG